MSKKFKVNFVINLIKLKLIFMSILFWPETQIVDLVDRKNSYIGTSSQVIPAGIQGSVHTNGCAKTSIILLQVK